jgi:ribose transport system ATP-binding protein
MSLLEVQNVSKHYGPVIALRDANLTVEEGEVHALLGANGAGKSTLVKTLTGVIYPDGGRIAVRGEDVTVGSPRGARKLGFAPVFQDPALVPDLTVLQNFRLTDADADAVRGWLERMELEVDLTELVSELSLPTLRMLDLARALAFDPVLLLLDEITAALPSDLAERVFAVVRDWSGRGRSVLFISHRLAEVTAICDNATVLRDGATVGSLKPRAGEEERIVELMLGQATHAVAADIERIKAADVPPAPEPESSAAEAERPPEGAPALEVRDLPVGESEEGVSFTLRAGEILGVAALEGQGQDVLFETLAGARRSKGGEVTVGGKPLKPRTPYDAIRAGVVLVPADRMLALLPQRPVRENIAAPLYNRPLRWGPIRLGDERRRVNGAIERLSIDTRAGRQARRLSGGNQQKLTIARWLASGFNTMLCFDPTRGIDVGTKRQIYALLRELAEGGAAILLFTSELPEIQLVCDRTLVLYRGAITTEMPASEATEANLLRAAHGLNPELAA